MNYNIQNILNIFEEDFNTVYTHITGRQRKEISYLVPTIFVRWYYSALFQETILSPAVIIESQEENTFKLNGFYSMCVHTKNKRDGRIEFTYKKEFYSIEDHPIYKDFDILKNYVSPILYINEDFTLKQSDINKLQHKLSISDKYYVEFLFDLALKTGILTKMPSLFETCVQVNNSCDFYTLNAKGKFNLLVEYSADICSDILNNEFSYEIDVISPEIIHDFLKNPISIDDMFITIFNNSGIDLKGLWKKSDDSVLSEEDSNLLSSVLYMGIIMDKAFIYIFGHYLRLIRPLYSFPMNFREILNGLYTTIAIDGERELELFMPCTTYMHTPLGKLYFNSGLKEKPLPPIPIDKIYASVLFDRQEKMMYHNTGIIKNEYKKIYLFKATLNKDRTLWKKIEVSGKIPINKVFSQILLMFMLPADLKYTLKLEEKSKKTKYISFENIEIISNPNSTISDISPENGISLNFIAENNSIRLDFIDCFEGCSEIIYPRIVEQSRDLTEREHLPLYFD